MALLTPQHWVAWEGDTGEKMLPGAGTLALCKCQQRPSLRGFPKDHLVQSSHFAYEKTKAQQDEVTCQPIFVGEVKSLYYLFRGNGISGAPVISGTSEFLNSPTVMGCNYM